MDTNARQQAIAQAWADREAARMARAIQGALDQPEHVRIGGGRCRCGWEGKTYRSVAAHIGQMKRRGA